MIDKNAQRARAAQFELEQLAQGKTVPVLPALKPFGTNISSSSAAGLVVPSTPAFKVTTVTVPPKTHHTQPANGTPKSAAKYVRKVKGRLTEPFTNSLGQVINVGDSVVAVSQGYNKSIRVRVATYVGLRKDSQGRVTSVSVSGEVTERKYVSGKGYVTMTAVRTSSLPAKRIFKS